jgi:hypothetical protein
MQRKLMLAVQNLARRNFAVFETDEEAKAWLVEHSGER